MNRHTQFLALAALPLLVAAASAQASISNPRHFVNAGAWSAGAANTTSQLWVNLGDNPNPLLTGLPDPSLTNPIGLTGSTLAPTGLGFRTGSQNFYSFAGNHGANFTIYNHGGATGSISGGTHVVLQTAGSLNPDFSHNLGAISGDSLNPLLLNFTRTNGTPIAAELLNFATVFQQSGVNSSMGPVDWQELKWEFWLPSWTGDFRISADIPVHSMFSAAQVDTAISAQPFALTAPVPEPASLGAAGLGATLLLLRRRRR